MITCKTCGIQLADNAKFCPDCGTKVEQASPAQDSAAPPAQPVQGGYGYASQGQGGFAPEKAKKPVNKKILLFAGVAVALIAVVVLLVSLLGGDGKAGSGLYMDGTLKNDKMTFEDVMGAGITLTFEKEGGYSNAAGDASSNVPADVGYYVIDHIIQGDETYDADALKDMDIDYYICINEDGSAEIYTDTLIKGTWTPGRIDYMEDGEEVKNDYTLDGDTLTLELSDGFIKFFFKRSGGTPPASGSAGDLSELQRQWNGTWYGALTVNSGTGKYDDDLIDEDAYMVVDVNAEGQGTFSVYLSDLEEWVRVTCQAYDYGLDAIDGEYLNSRESMKLSDWIFRPSPIYDNYNITTDYVDNEDDSFNFTLYFKPWGAGWEEEIASGRSIYPPGLDDYMKKVNNGEPSPFGDGENAQSSSSANNEEPQNTDGDSGSGSGASDVSYELVKFTLSLTLPSGDWIDKGITGGASGGVTTAHFYYKESHANAPRVDICESFSDTFDHYKDRWENYADIGSKTIGGINLEGRTYTAFGMNWIEYIGEIGNGQHLCITIIDLDPDSGETKALLESITFH